VEIRTREGEIIVIHFHNPCKKFDVNRLAEIERIGVNKVVVWGF